MELLNPLELSQALIDSILSLLPLCVEPLHSTWFSLEHLARLSRVLTTLIPNRHSLIRLIVALTTSGWLGVPGHVIGVLIVTI